MQVSFQRIYKTTATKTIYTLFRKTATFYTHLRIYNKLVLSLAFFRFFLLHFTFTVDGLDQSLLMKNHENNLTKKRKRKEDDDDVNDGSYSKKHSIYVSYLNSTEVELRER